MKKYDVLSSKNHEFQGEEVKTGKSEISTVLKGKNIILKTKGGGAKISYFGEIYTPVGKLP